LSRKFAPTFGYEASWGFPKAPVASPAPVNFAAGQVPPTATTLPFLDFLSKNCPQAKRTAIITA